MLKLNIHVDRETTLNLTAVNFQALNCISNNILKNMHIMHNLSALMLHPHDFFCLASCLVTHSTSALSSNLSCFFSIIVKQMFVPHKRVGFNLFCWALCNQFALSWLWALMFFFICLMRDDLIYYPSVCMNDK